MYTLDQQTIQDMLASKEYAHSYMEEFLYMYIATQIKLLREGKDLTQEQLGALAEMHQERIAVLENVNYTGSKVSTLLKLAKAFDLTLNVSFENFSTQLHKLEAFSAESIESLERTERVRDLSALLAD